MREILRILIWAWFMLIGSCMGKFVVEKNSLRVTSPESIKDVYECAIGNFGLPQYSVTMVGTVTYPESGRHACKAFDEAGMSFKSTPGGQPIIVLVDRGECYFTLKVWNAQKAGAAAILIADYIDEPLITMDTQEEDNLHTDYGQNVTIPAMLISSSVGVSLKNALANGDIVNINMDTLGSLPRPDEGAENSDDCSGKCESTGMSLSTVWIFFLVLDLVALGIGGYALYMYRTQRYIDSEIREIMAEYKPLDDHVEATNHMADEV